ncbi:PREDICTED: uncharacterized protein LOC105965730 [Erythranthe guttata]|uniref:uncharacterized protein LOC105965730 n=1 Tax=Erythranthe guttata TaxID=4155 RepID=UPI00064D8D96|nr:PREDICTED: uncharacterized protein LOC105965730 [Erythranthe guttata]|eukprot:XP_012845754.1 PREDICTED: uncharacterized protein LOC105965730 [Erythranthe guttata]
MNDEYTREYTAMEVKSALDSMHPLKSLGRDVSHYMKRNTVDHMAIKLDMSKAMTILNERGIRKDDPLLPYLFLFCAEALSALIHQEKLKGSLSGLAVCRGAPKQMSPQRNALKRSSKNYEDASVVEKHENYLGLPSAISKLKREVFSNVREKVYARLRGWKEKFLSKGGKEILIKVIAQEFPTYAMSCFKLPDTFMKDLESQMANFGAKIRRVGSSPCQTSVAFARKRGHFWAEWFFLCPERTTWLLMDKDGESRQGNSSNSSNNENWKWLWGLNLPSKVKLFLWMACKNLLPTCVHLRNQRVLEDNWCVICNECEEDVIHILFYCSFSRQVWALSNPY